MASVVKFDRPMIERYLQSKELKYDRDEDGDFVAVFEADEDTGCTILISLAAEGEKQEIYAVRVVSDKQIPRAEWGRAALICNTWNKERRWPKAYLHIDNVDADQEAYIRLESQIDLEAGIHEQLFSEFTDGSIAAGFMFWSWAHKEQGL